MVYKFSVSNMLTEGEISNRIIGVTIEVHQSLGPGLLESTYKVLSVLEPNLKIDNFVNL